MTPADLDALCSVIAQHAPGLREAGVTSLELDDVKIAIAPAVPNVPIDMKEGKDPVAIDPLDDPETYGGRVPGFQRPRRKSGRDE
jgi:hypothetical protein